MTNASDARWNSRRQMQDAMGRLPYVAGRSDTRYVDSSHERLVWLTAAEAKRLRGRHAKGSQYTLRAATAADVDRLNR